MSASVLPTVPSIPRLESPWTKPALATYNNILLTVALAISYLLKNDTAFNMIIGAIIANATNVNGFYFGSSSGSERKTELGTQSPPA